MASTANCSFGGPANRAADTCYVTAAVVGQGGPERRVVDKVPTTVRGQPALRGGKGAEAPYLTRKGGDGR